MTRPLIKALVCTLALFSATTYAAVEDWFFKPNIGLDIFGSGMEFEPGFGEGHFSETYTQGNGNIGVQMHEYFGFELGYERSSSHSKHSFYPKVNGTSLILGSDLPNIAESGDEAHEAQMFINGWHASALLYVPCKKITLERTHIILMLGAAWLRGHYETVPNNNSVLNSFTSYPVKWQSESETVFRGGVGFRHMITDAFGARMLYVFEQSSKLEAVTAVPVGNAVGNSGAAYAPLVSGNYTVKPKNNHMFGFGLFAQLS